MPCAPAGLIPGASTRLIRGVPTHLIPGASAAPPTRHAVALIGP
jgi:hypothetical protein